MKVNTLICRPDYLERAIALINSDKPVILPKSISDKVQAMRNEIAKTNADIEFIKGKNEAIKKKIQEWPPKNEADLKVGNQFFFVVSEDVFLAACVDRSGIVVEKVSKGLKHYLFDGGLFAIKLKGEYLLEHSVLNQVSGDKDN